MKALLESVECVIGGDRLSTCSLEQEYVPVRVADEVFKTLKWLFGEVLFRTNLSF